MTTVQLNTSDEATCPECGQVVGFEVYGEDDSVGLVGSLEPIPLERCEHLTDWNEDEAVFTPEPEAK